MAGRKSRCSCRFIVGPIPFGAGEEEGTKLRRNWPLTSWGVCFASTKNLPKWWFFLVRCLEYACVPLNDKTYGPYLSCNDTFVLTWSWHGLIVFWWSCQSAQQCEDQMKLFAAICEAASLTVTKQQSIKHHMSHILWWLYCIASYD